MLDKELAEADAWCEYWRREAFRKYPTPDAYEAACLALEKHRKRADSAQEEVAALHKVTKIAEAAAVHLSKANKLLEESKASLEHNRQLLSKEKQQAERERDALLEALHHAHEVLRSAATMQFNPGSIGIAFGIIQYKAQSYLTQYATPPKEDKANE